MSVMTTPVYKIPLPGGTAASGPYESFYVPRFEVKIDKEKLPPQVVRDVIKVSYTDSIEKIDSFDLVVSNYESEPAGDWQHIRAKYMPHSRTEYAHIFDPGQTIELWMGYGTDLHLMLTGQITTLEPNFPASGGLTMSVRGLNVLHQFRTQQYTYAWWNKTDSEIAWEIGQNPLPTGDDPSTARGPGVGIPVQVSETAKATERSNPYVFVNNQYPIVFLMERARRLDYELVLRETDDPSKRQYLYFGPSQDRNAPTYLLEWGKSLVSFTPTLTTANQVAEVWVLGWDRVLNQKIEGKAIWSDLLTTQDPAEKNRQARLVEAFGNRREVITNQPVRNQQEADDLARNILSRLRKGMVQGSGTTVGLPDLRAGRTVEIRNLGKLFDGLYYVTDTTHSIGEGGYITSFSARREQGIRR